MLGKLLREVMRRHLWPIPVVALLVAVAAPLLFLKSAPPDGPVASRSAPSTAPGGRLPAHAQALLAAGDAAQGASRRPGRAASDPFQPPSPRGRSSAGGSSSAGGDQPSAAKTSAPEPDAAAGATEPVAVVITNADGTAPTTPTTPIGGDGATPPSPDARAVDVRFGEQSPARLHRRIPRLQTFVSGDRVVAIFVKYSPTRHKAVFAIAPNTLVSGDVECRRKESVCRYVDIPAGKDVRLMTIATDGTLVSHRLEVARIERTSQPGATSPPANGSCLLGKLLTLTTNDPPLTSDAC